MCIFEPKKGVKTRSWKFGDSGSVQRPLQHRRQPTTAKSIAASSGKVVHEMKTSPTTATKGPKSYGMIGIDCWNKCNDLCSRVRSLGPTHNDRWPRCSGPLGKSCEQFLPYSLSKIYHILQLLSLIEELDFSSIYTPSSFIIRILFLQHIFQRLKVRILHCTRSWKRIQNHQSYNVPTFGFYLF